MILPLRRVVSGKGHNEVLAKDLSRVETSVTRLGYFWKVLSTNFHTKVAKIFDDFMCNLEKQPNFKFINCYGNFVENWTTFNSYIWS